MSARTPSCLYAAIAEGAPRFVLVLEDLADARQGDQIAGCSVAHAEAAVTNLAGLHGPTWCDETLRARPWLGGDTTDVITADFMAPVIAMAADGFAERFAAELEPVEAAVLEASRSLLPVWMFERGERFAVLHGDYRLDNLLFPDDDPGPRGGGRLADHRPGAARTRPRLLPRDLPAGRGSASPRARPGGDVPRARSSTTRPSPATTSTPAGTTTSTGCCTDRSSSCSAA